MKQIALAPSSPGVYMFRGRNEKILYVGKAKNLRNRLRSYFQNSSALDARKAAMVKLIKDFTFIATSNELEAFILEANLIKQHKPRFNIVLRDDKNYPYIRLTIQDKWPCIEVVRRIKKDGSAYFGPYVPAQSMHEALSFIRRHFTLRPCRYNLDKPIRPCIQHQMKKCPAPCAQKISNEAYRKIVDEVVLFLRGKRTELIAALEAKMRRLSEDMHYEEAASVRDEISLLQKAFESQKVISPDLGDIDVIGFYEDAEEGVNRSASVLFIRNGIITGSKEFSINDHVADDKKRAATGFVQGLYAREIIPPPVIILRSRPSDSSLLAWLEEKAGRRVRFESPQRGKKLDLLKMAEENARLLARMSEKNKATSAGQELAERLGMDSAPESIAAFDVSTIQGSESVGALVYWSGGAFRKDLYRHIKIRSVDGVDDYAMMRESVEKILTSIKEHLPDLVLIDGGRGQLEAAKEIISSMGLDLNVIAVAKKPDRAFVSSRKFIDLEDRAKSSLLLKRIRDEAHRFVISFHRKLRDKRLTSSVLDNIHGIGNKKRLELLRHFGSLQKIRAATVDEIRGVKGFNTKTAEKLLAELNKAE
ncbi:MAG: excinuclease ABC subunit UvrC [Nitrospiraceae bacterium]|nr:excinuclease ABC subunit UvrC [Nitrospiraceae bacterium]